MNSKQFLKEGFLEDAHEAHVDHEVQMARVDCYYAAEHAIVLHKLLRNISEEQGLEGWVASKITLANDYLKSVREHLEYQMINADADEGDFLPLAEGISPTKKKVSEDITDGDNSIQEFERGPWYVILRGQPVTENGEPKRFNWLNGAKTYFRSMLDEQPELAREIKSEYDKADDKKTVIYYTKKLPTTSSSNTQPETGQQVSEAGNKPGLWANIRAKRERIKSGSGERMRKPGSKGAPSNADLKSIRAASNESTELEESLADEFGEFAKKFGQQRGITIKPRDPKPRSPFPEPENKRIENPLERESLEARLKELQSLFDPAYEYSDDHAFWSEQNEIAKEIRSIKRTLAQQGVAEGSEQISIQVRKGRRKFATELSVDGKPAGAYQYDADSDRSIAEVYPEYKGKGFGKILVLHAIYTAAKLGMDFVEDESRTAEYDNVLDSLDSNGLAVNDDGYWYVTGEGEHFLKQRLKQGVAEDSGNAVEALIQVYNNRDQKIIKTKVFASEEEANRWADRNNAVILKLKDVAKKPALDETSSGSVATVVNPTPKNRAKVGTLFGGTYKQTNARSKK